MNKERLKAAKLGQSRYKGNPCQVCGDVDRYVSNGACCTCHIRKSREARLQLQELVHQARQNKGAA